MAAFFFCARNDFGRILVGDVVMVDSDHSPVQSCAVLTWPSWRITSAEDVPPDLVIGKIVCVYKNGQTPAA